MGLLLSIYLALGKMSKNRIVSKLCGAYIFFSAARRFFRSIPGISLKQCGVLRVHFSQAGSQIFQI